jgi:hypothetical protein
MRTEEAGDVVHAEEDDMTQARANVLGLAAESADRSILGAVLGGYNPGQSVNEARKGPIGGTL